MPRDHDSPEDLSAFLSRPEDLARALDARAAEERTRETLRKAAENANFAAAMKALEAGPKEEPARPAQPSERAEYNAAKTIPPRTRRDTLELEAKLVVRSDVLDARHRPTAKIQREVAPSPSPVAPPEQPAAATTREEAHEAQVAETPAPASGSYSTLEGLGSLGMRPAARDITTAGDESANTATPRDPKSDAMSMATAKTEPVAISEAAAEASAAPAPREAQVETPALRKQAAALPAPNQPTMVTRPSNNRGRLLALLAFALLAVLAIIFWNVRAESVGSQGTPAPTASAGPAAPPTTEPIAVAAPSTAEAASPSINAGTEDPPTETASPSSAISASTRVAPTSRHDASSRHDVSSPVPSAAAVTPPTAAPEKSSNRLGLPYDEKK